MSEEPGSAAPRGLQRAAQSLLSRPVLLIFVVAFAARSARNLVGGGFAQPNGYDPGVYYAAAAGLANGKLPYRDFTLVHPPGMALLEMPFAFLGRLTTDLTGYVAATVAVVALASYTAVLVVQVARAMGLSERGALTGGLVYALWTNAVAFEFVGRLEPVGNLFLACGLLAFYRAGEAEGPRSRRLLLLSGAAFGAAVCIKLWWIVPVAAFLGWILVRDRRVRAGCTIAVGGAVTLVVVDGPFLLASGREMWRMIVLDQLGRPDNGTEHSVAFSYLTLGNWSAGASMPQMTAIAAVGGVLLAAVIWRSWSTRAVHAVVVLLVAQLLQLWFQPIWYPFYADFITVALSLVVAAAVAGTDRAPDSSRSWIRANRLPTGIVATLATSTAAFLITWQQGPDASPSPFPRAELSAALTGIPCVTSDQPMALIQLDRLSSNFQNDCPLWIDPVGRHLRLSRNLGPPSVPGTTLAWNQLFTRYLRSGDALVLTRDPAALGLMPRFIAKLERDGLQVEAGGYPVYRTR